MSATPFLTGLTVGHAQDAAARTGCTVLLGPFRGACDVRGAATGSRELDTLRAPHVVPAVDALLLTGGSAFGLAAADGVMAWLEARARGFETGAARVPIVPAAVIYDLGVGRADVRPDAAMGRAACAAARADAPAEGAVGAGTGATVGKVLGPAAAEPGGFGCASAACGAWRMVALVVVNALGDVLAADGSILAGARTPDGACADSARLLREGRAGAGGPLAPPGTNTTLAVVATDAPLDGAALLVLARAAGAALGRRISPVNTLFDGDVVCALSTAAVAAAVAPGTQLALGAAGAAVLEEALERAVTVGR
ncbi:MAG: P1 family peptidase [Gemmatimonadota bacterium]